MEGRSARFQSGLPLKVLSIMLETRSPVWISDNIQYTRDEERLF